MKPENILQRHTTDKLLDEVDEISFHQQGGFYNIAILRDGVAIKQHLPTLDL